MKKYLGSSMTAFAAVLSPIIVVLPFLFGIGALISEVSVPTVLVFLGCVFCSCIWVVYLRQIGGQLYAWGRFQDNGVWVTSLFSKPHKLKYDRCVSCGIGYYTHGLPNSTAGRKVYFVFLSYDAFDEKYRSSINFWKPTRRQIKIKFNEELYQYLISVFPTRQARMLSRDYKRYFQPAAS